MTAASRLAAAAPAVQQTPAALRVLFVIPGEAHGSSMIFARRQADGLAAQAVQVDLFHLGSRTSLPRLAGEWLRFRRRVRQFRPQVVHAQFGTVTALFAVLAAGKLPVVITYRGSDLNRVPAADGPRAWAGRCMSQLAALGATRIVCVSRALRQRLWWRRGIVRVLASGVDTDLFRPLEREAIRARLGWKEQDRIVLFNAGHDSRNKRLDLAEAAVVRARLSVPGLQMKVLHGEVPPGDIPEWMNAADCLLVTSDSEGSPAVVQEALATDLPIVSVDTGDVAERLAGVEHTRIAERDAQRLAEALVGLTVVPLRCAGRARAEECSFRSIARHLVRIYRDALGAAALRVDSVRAEEKIPRRSEDREA